MDKLRNNENTKKTKIMKIVEFYMLVEIYQGKKL